MRPTWGDPPAYRDSGSGGGAHFGRPTLLPATKFLLLVNAGVFLGLWLLARVLGLGAVEILYQDVLALAPQTWRDWFPFVPLWQLVTYGFLHDLGSLYHILWNSLILYFFGTMLEGVVGSRRFVATYMIALVLGGVAQLGVQLATGQLGFTVGASGATMAVVVAMAVLQPNATVLFLFIPITLKIFALMVVGIDLFSLLSRTPSSTAVVVHLTGAAYGFLAAKKGWLWRDPIEELEERRDERRRERVVADEERLDELLARIHERGMSSLTKSEREFLRRVSSRE